MTDQSHQLVQKLWNYCNILRDDGLSYGDYVEQLTFLLFLKMADEQGRPPFNKRSPIPKGFDWASLLAKDGDELEIHYRHLLETLGKEKGMLGVIFRKAQNKIQDPAKLRRLIVDLIDKEQWSSLSADVKGDAYEGLLQKNAEDVKGGAGQYFTPRPLIAAIVDVMRPEPKMTICDPACGTGGFLLAAYNYLSDQQHYQLDREQKKRLAGDTLYSVELVDGVARLCCMNMLLHGIGDSGSGVPPLGSDEERRRDASATLTLSRYQRKETERFKCFAYDDLIKRDKVNLDIFWLKDESLEDSANLPAPDIIAAEIVEDLEAALEQFAEIAEDLGSKDSQP
jgi:type I restriction enzyme M protein